MWLFAKVFSMKFGGVASFGRHQRAIYESFLRKKSYFPPIRERFLPQKFPAIWYMSRNYLVIVVSFSGRVVVLHFGAKCSLTSVCKTILRLLTRQCSLTSPSSDNLLTRQCHATAYEQFTFLCVAKVTSYCQ